MRLAPSWSLVGIRALIRLFGHKDADEIATPLFPIGYSEPWSAISSPPQYAQIGRGTLDSNRIPSCFVPIATIRLGLQG